MKGRMSPRRWLALGLLFLLIPAALILTPRLGGRVWYLTSLLIICFTLAAFFLAFEARRPQARELVVLSVLCALAVAARAAFVAVPHFKPMTGIIMISGMAFGPAAGFLTGAVSGFVSNFLFGQGPWTPWQMFAFGMIGFLAGILYQKGILKARKFDLCIYGFLSVFLIYGGIMNPASILMSYGYITKSSLIAYYISGAPVDLVHAASTVIFLWLLSRPLLEKLERIKVKYGLIQESEKR